MTYNRWNVYKFDEITFKITDGSHSSPKSVEYGMKMASVKDMRAYGFEEEGCKKISHVDYVKLVKSGCKPQVNDILLAKDGNTYLDSSFVVREEKDIVVLSSIAIITPDTDVVIPDYLNYFLTDKRNKQDIKNNFGSGSAIPRIVLKDIKKIPILLPSLIEQRVIVDKLVCLDNKIELNNEMNNTLEEMAQALFKRWFVDFEFPNEDGEPYKNSGGAMIESELGMIPHGWNISKLDQFSNITMGVSPSSKSYNEESIGTPLLNGAADFKGKLIKPSKFTTEPKKNCKKGDMVFGVRATIGNTVFTDKEYALGRGVAAITPSKVEYRELIYYNLNYSMEKLISNASGSVFLSLKKADITDLKICCSEEKVNQFHSISRVLIDRIIENDIESEMLKEQRDLLLSKLMSGQIRVEDIEANL